jgi:hypothetical protein
MAELCGAFANRLSHRSDCRTWKLLDHAIHGRCDRDLRNQANTGSGGALCSNTTFLLFALAAKDPITYWNASWSDVTHWQYFKNTMFGPDCGATECLYTFFTALLVGGVAYSIGAYLVLRWNIISK